MHSTPERNLKDDKRSRAEQYGSDHPYTCLPDVDGCSDYMTGLFLDSGKVGSSGMSVAPLSWQDIAAFNQCNALNMTAWECQTLMSMSRAYTDWYHRGCKQKDIPDEVPYIDPTKNAGAHMMRSRDRSKKRTEDALNDYAG